MDPSTGYGTTLVPVAISVGDIHDLAEMEAPNLNTEELTVERLMLLEWLDSLAPRDQWVIWRRYWQGATTAEIADDLGRSEHWVNERQRTLLDRAFAFMTAN